LADEGIVTKGKLKDVLVRVKNGTAGKFPAPKEPVTLAQRGRLSAPPVLGVMAGQTLRVKNSDDTFHNVHGQISGKNLWNKPHAPKDADLSLETSMHADDIVEIRCDIHAWMHAYAVVQDHPF